MGTFFNRKKIYLDHLFPPSPIPPRSLPLPYLPNCMFFFFLLRKNPQNPKPQEILQKNTKWKSKQMKKKKRKKRTASQNKYLCFVLAIFFWVWNKVCINRVHFYKNAVEFSIYVCTCVLMWIYLDTQCTKICFGDSLQEVLTNYTYVSLFLCACRQMVKDIETECRGSGG